ncbi:MAG TPA: NnrU family protein [Burkholderiales bacterium]|nr:NnrU family protein [Burkholderiales bacterium]
MTYLILGLILFLTVHSVRIFADGWRTRTMIRVGEGPWKGIYSLISIAGFVLLVWGYGQARSGGIVLYEPPAFMRHIAGLLMLVSLVLVAAAYVPRNHIKAALGHPMLAGVKLWAFAHLLSNGRLADVVLFGAFLAWAIVNFVAARRRDRVVGTVYPAGQAMRTALTLVAGMGAWAALVFGLHLWLIGVPPYF